MFKSTLLKNFKNNISFNVIRNDNINAYVVMRKDGLNFDIKINDVTKSVTFLEFPMVLNKVIGYNFSNDFNIFGVFINDIETFNIL